MKHLEDRPTANVSISPAINLLYYGIKPPVGQVISLRTEAGKIEAPAL